MKSCFHVLYASAIGIILLLWGNSVPSGAGTVQPSRAAGRGPLSFNDPHQITAAQEHNRFEPVQTFSAAPCTCNCTELLPEQQTQLGSVNDTGLTCNQHGVKLTIITPWSRRIDQYFSSVYKSIKFECVYQWIIVYNYEKVKDELPTSTAISAVIQAANDVNSTISTHKILEVVYRPHRPGTWVSANRQRNLGLSLVNDGFVYFLDDDNAIHSQFWDWFAKNVSLGKFYTFDQLRASPHGLEPLVLQGNKLRVYCFDTGMLLADRALIGDTRWADKPIADGMFISELVAKHPDKHEYVPQVLSYHNRIQLQVRGIPWAQVETMDYAEAYGRHQPHCN